MFWFGKSRKMYSDPIGDILKITADKILRTGHISEPCIGFLKVETEYNIMSAKQFIDRLDFVIEKMEEMIDMAQKDKRFEKAKGQVIINIYERIPDMIKRMKVQRDDLRNKYLKTKEEKEKLINILNDVLDKTKRMES